MIEDYCKGRSNIIIEKYPYHVYPAVNDVYGTGNYDAKNSLAAYYNFGLKISQKIGGAICKIDCDQVYIEAPVSAQFTNLKNNKTDINQNYGAGLWGINSFVYNNTLLIVGDEILNGIGDTYILSDSFCLEYFQSKFYEIPKYFENIKTLAYHDSPCLFHFRRKVQSVNNFIKEEFTLENFVEQGNEIMHLDNDSIELFEQNIRPLLIKLNSPYSGIVFS